MKTTLGQVVVLDEPFKIWPNYPNPFSQSTNFSFYLSKPSTVSLEIYNILGQKVRTVAKNEEFSKGKAYLSWDGRTDSGKKAAPGVYLYRIDIEGDSRVNKLMLLK
jgi:flagellar hook assembly protein FlgD